LIDLQAMTSVSKLLAGFAAILALNGCVHPGFVGMKNYWELNTQHIQKLKPGMTQAEVQEILGKPPWRLAVPQEDEEIWNYRYLDYQTRMRTTLYFDGRGVLKRVTQELDMDFYSGR
jgi:outer membrane protein assembly factor BamE (lipoprotein component of BamABCDE complex)